MLLSNYGGAEEDRTPDPLRARQVLSQLSYDPLFLLRLFRLLFVMSILSLGYILTYAPLLFHAHASIKQKILVKNLSTGFSCSLVVMCIFSLGYILTYAPLLFHAHASIKQKILVKIFCQDLNSLFYMSKHKILAKLLFRVFLKHSSI